MTRLTLSVAVEGAYDTTGHVREVRTLTLDGAKAVARLHWERLSASGRIRICHK